MTGLGSFAERQEFFRSEAKPPYRFRDRASTSLMTADGWLGEWRLLRNFRRNRPFARPTPPQRQLAVVPRYSRHAHADEENAGAKRIAMLHEALKQPVGNNCLVLQQLDLSEMQVADDFRIDVAEGRVHV